MHRNGTLGFSDPNIVPNINESMQSLIGWLTKENLIQNATS